MHLLRLLMDAAFHIPVCWEIC